MISVTSVNLPKSSFEHVLIAFSSSPDLKSVAPLHHLIASRGSQPDVVQKLRELKPQKLEEVLRERATNFEVTPLHLAVMVGDKEVVQCLLDRSAPLDIKDSNGCTPLHLAAMNGDKSMLRKLINTADKVNNSIRQMKNCLFATAEEILESTKYPEPVGNVAYYKNENNEIVPIPPKKFKKLTEAVYCPYAIVTSYYHIKGWADETRPASKYAEEWELKYRHYKSQPPCIYLDKDPVLGLGVRARSHISAFTIIDVYGGSYIDNKGSIFSIAGLEAQHYATVITRGNDHVPNTMVLAGYVNGVCLPFAVTLKEIQQGQQVHYNYTLSHSCKWGHYCYNPEPEFEKFASSADYMQIVNEQKKIEQELKIGNIPPFQDFLKILSNYGTVEYILDTPRVLAEFLLRGIISPKTLNALLNFGTSSRKGYEKNNPKVECLIALLRSVVQLLTILKEMPKEQSDELRSYFLKLFTRHRVIFVLQSIEIFVKDPRAKQNPTQFCKNLEIKLQFQEKILKLAPNLTLTDQDNKNNIQCILQENSSFITYETIHNLLIACELSINTNTRKTLGLLFKEL